MHGDTRVTSDDTISKECLSPFCLCSANKVAENTCVDLEPLTPQIIIKCIGKLYVKEYGEENTVYPAQEFCPHWQPQQASELYYAGI